MKDHIELEGRLLTIGQEVYLEPCGNFARRGQREIRPAIIQSFGRRYIHVSFDGGAWKTTRVDMATKRSVEDGDCNSYYQLWFSVEEYEHAIEREYKEESITRFFRDWGNPKRLSDSVIWDIYDTLAKEGVLPPKE